MTKVLRISLLVLLGMFCVLLVACRWPGSRAALAKRFAEHPARTSAAWTGWRQEHPGCVVAPAPDFLLDYIRIDNTLNDYQQVPKPALQWQPFAADVTAAVAEFPPEIRKQLDECVVGIFLASDLGSSAYTELLRDAPGSSRGIIVLDPLALDRKANDWATWKENTPFASSSDITTTLTIEADGQNLRKNAIAYILLHELGHVVGVVKKIHASWWDGGDPADYPFTSLSWVMKGKLRVSRWDERFPGREKIKFYAEPTDRLPGDKRLDLYPALADTNFVSLYAATSVYEDFAETYAMYVHVVLQHRPWTLTVCNKGKAVCTLSAPILRDECDDKRMFLQSLFRRSVFGVPLDIAP